MERKIRCRNSVLIVVLLILCYIKCCFGDASIIQTTYSHLLPGGQSITCNLCPPGTLLSKHCNTDGGDSVCKKCDEGFYNNVHNQAASCAKCDTKCKYPEREYIAKNCTGVSNISCTCKSGYYRQQGSSPDNLCLKIEPCPPGKGVKVEGNSSSNTVCEECMAGFFSANKSFTEKCQSCQRCTADQKVVEACRGDADTVCGPKDKDQGMSIGAIIGIAVGVLVVVTLVVCIVLFLYRRKLEARCSILPCFNRSGNRAKGEKKNGSARKTENGLSLLTSDTAQNGHIEPVPDGHSGGVANGHGGGMANGHSGGLANGHSRGLANGHGGGIANGHVGILADGHTGNVEVPRECDRLMYAERVSPRIIDVPLPQFWKDIFYKLREDITDQDYRQFFRLLLPCESPDSIIQEIEINFKLLHGIKEVIYLLLIRWYKIEDGTASMSKVIKALDDWNRQDLVRKYSQYVEIS